MSERVPDAAFALPDVAIDRSPLGATVTDFILGAQTWVVVIHGKRASGKTELMKRWVIPGLQSATEKEGYEVLYGDCTPRVPDAFVGPHGSVRIEDIPARKCIVVVDSFDNVFDLPRSERREVLDRLFEAVQRKDWQTTVVLVADTRHLTSIYALTSYDPAISNAVMEVKPVGIAEGLEQLSAMQPETAVTCAPEVLQALGEDAGELEERGWDVTIALIQLLDARFRQLRIDSGTQSVDSREYERLGRLGGILRARLQDRLEAWEAERSGSAEIGRAILEQVLQANAHGVPADLTDLAPRLGVPPDQVQVVLARMVEPRGLLRERGGGDYELMPRQLGAIVEEDVATRSPEDERARRIVEEGLRSWQLLGNLLKRPRFEEVHRARAHLILDNEHIRFLLLCALRQEGGDSDGAQYWLTRIGDRVDAMDILMSSLFEGAREARLRAAALLVAFPEPDVRERLRILALTDSDPAVRAQAVASLAAMQDEPLMQALMHEAQDRKSPHRAEAVEALRIFRDERVAGLLQALVNDPETELSLRETAIRTLALLDMPQAVDALLAIALDDPDQNDRDAAAAALASTRSPELNRHLLTRLRAPDKIEHVRRTRIALSAIALGLVSLAGAVAFYSVREAGIEVVAAGIAVVLLASVVLLLPTRTLLLGLLNQEVKRASVRGVLAVTLFTLSALSLFLLFHGSAHMITRRWRRGLLLFGWEVFGVFLAMAAPSFVALSTAMGWFYLAAAGACFAGSYMVDVVGVLFDTVVFTDATRLLQRKVAIYRQLFANPVAAGIVLDGLTSPEPADVAWARALFRRFGRFTQPDLLVDRLKAPDEMALPLVLEGLRNRKTEGTVRRLEELWRGADRSLRWRIAGVLCANPTERSLQALDKVRPEMGPMLKLRSAWAGLQFKFAVWPLPARVAILLLVPTAAAFFYHGTMVLKNPAWSLIVSLRQPWQPFAKTPKVAIVKFLVETYPKPSLNALRQLLREGKYRATLGPVRASVAQGLVQIYAQGVDSNDQGFREELLSAADSFAVYLASEDSGTFVRSLGVLQTMAGARDTALGDKAVGLLQGFVLRAPDTLRRKQAIDSLASLPYDRALPALDGLLALRPPWKLETEIRTQMGRVALQTYEAIPREDLPREGRNLTATISKLKAPPLVVSNIRQQLEKEINQAERASDTKTCDRNADGTCDSKDSALALVAERPTAEDGYRDLLNQYLSDRLYAEAKAEFVGLKRDYPGSVWPSKVLSELYHEYLGPQNPAYFSPAYDEMAALRRSAAYRDLRSDTTEFYRFEADFAEIALSARRFGEAESAARQLMATTKSPVYQLNMALFVYFAAVARRDRTAAEARLAQLEGVIDSLPSDFYNGWIYPGTVQFIKEVKVPKELEEALVKLCKSESWYGREEGATVLEENRNALRVLDGAVTLH